MVVCWVEDSADAADAAASYDANIKFLLADKQVLARILKYAVGNLGIWVWKISWSELAVISRLRRSWWMWVCRIWDAWVSLGKQTAVLSGRDDILAEAGGILPQ